jgi:hypothetical protein
METADQPAQALWAVDVFLAVSTHEEVALRTQIHAVEDIAGVNA